MSKALPAFVSASALLHGTSRKQQPCSWDANHVERWTRGCAEVRIACCGRQPCDAESLIDLPACGSQ